MDPLVTFCTLDERNFSNEIIFVVIKFVCNKNMRLFKFKTSRKHSKHCNIQIQGVFLWKTIILK